MEPIISKKPWASLKRLLTVVFLAGAIIAASTGGLEQGLDHMGLARLATYNAIYLEKAQQRTLSGFLILSAIKSSLAMLEGSTVGIGFNLQVGDLVQSVYDYIDVAWKAVLAGGTAIVILKLLLQVLDLMDQWTLVIMLTAVLALVSIRWWLPYHDWLRQMSQKTAVFFALLCAAFYLLVPLTITAAMTVSDLITRPVIESAYKELNQLKKDLSPDDASSLGEMGEESAAEDSPGLLDFKSHFSKLKKRLKATARLLELKAHSMAVLTFRLTAGYLFDCIVFPMALFFCLWPITKAIFKLALGSLDH